MHVWQSTGGLIRKAFVVAGLLAFIPGLAACSQLPGGHPAQVESITFGDLNVESSAFVYIAEEQHLFANNALNVTVKSFDTAPNAIQAMLDEQVDLVTTGEFSFVARIVAQDNLSVIGSMDKYQAFYLVGRKDLGIEKVTDLSGKKVGVVLQALPEFYLGRFLDLQGLNLAAVTVVNVKPADWVQAISSGKVDAIVVSRPYLSQIQALLQDRMAIWPVQSGQNAFALLCAKSAWLNAHPQLARRFLRSLEQAEQYASLHPSQAQAIVQRRLSLDDEYLDSSWSQHHFSLSLDESLVAAMEDEARWMIENNLTPEKQVPNFLNYISEAPLKSLKPEEVNVIH